jgi:ribosomal protein S27E
VKTWQRAAFRLSCGHCGEEIRRGDPVLLFQMPEGKWTKVRCGTCAGEAVPVLEPLPARPVEVVSRPKAKRPASVGGLALDWKAKASLNGA